MEGQWKVKVSKGKKPRPNAWSCPVCSTSNPPISKQCSSCNTFRPQREIPGVSLAEVQSPKNKAKAKAKQQKSTNIQENRTEGSEFSESVKHKEVKVEDSEFESKAVDHQKPMAVDLRKQMAVDPPEQMAVDLRKQMAKESSEVSSSSPDQLLSTLANLVYVILLGENEFALDRCVRVFSYCLFHSTLPKDARKENAVSVVSQDLLAGRRVVINRDPSEIASWITLAGLHKIPPEQCGLLVVGNVPDMPEIPAGMNSWTLEVDQLQAFF
eukprot:GHVP01037080.1.p1 GENE.GHVP01037080.1~~GHVP01037080.1.p1  ORF type:complete len:269 (+),score=59.81 GHVP01037080.1:12-818(+)